MTARDSVSRALVVLGCWDIIVVENPENGYILEVNSQHQFTKVLRGSEIETILKTAIRYFDGTA
jgi:hypothetical protein